MNNKFIGGLLLGAIAGAALALFISSDKGQEIIGDIKDAAGDAAESAKTKLAHLQGELNGLMKKGKTLAGDLEKKAKDAMA